jgi:uncharacterized NAD(P)/FAD-binding protein YdhS
MTRIAIIGAGLSGRLLALNLSRQASSAVSILMIDRGGPHYMGPAYSDDADYLLLNVPAGRMGAFSNDPQQFLRSIHNPMGFGLPEEGGATQGRPHMREIVGEHPGL